MSKATSILLNDDLDAFVDQQVSEGRYQTKSDVVEAGLRLLKEQDSDLEALRAALIEGEESGIAEDFDFDVFLSEKRARREKRG
jgi:antitoxin ParD1/3/4